MARSASIRRIQGRSVITMIAAKLVELIEVHAPGLTSEITSDLMTNGRTAGFRAVRAQDLEQRIFEILNHLGDWIGDPHSERVQAEFTDWGRRRFDQGIPLTELIFAIVLIKQHLRRYINDNGLVDAAFPRVESDYILPLHLHSIQELNARVGQFFDEALYDLACGYEDRARSVR